jgi:hypothetical protein
MPRNRGSQYDEVQKAARFLPRLISSARSLDDFHQHHSHISELHAAVTACSDEPAVLRSLLVHSQLPQQLCKCLTLGLQLLSVSKTAVLLKSRGASAGNSGAARRHCCAAA